MTVVLWVLIVVTTAQGWVIWRLADKVSQLEKRLL